jgi:NADPH2:quinone reductase
MTQANMGSVEARVLRLAEKAASVDAVAPRLETRTLAPRDGEALIEITAAGINPSDAKAAIGMMPHAVFPRTPGRDFCGIVRAGPAHLIGKEVFGSSGKLGITLDGTHGSHLLVEASAVVEKPANLTSEEAAAIGVPFVTAAEGFRRSGFPKPGETVLIMGVNGKVGQAAAQIAAWKGARVLGVARREEPFAGTAFAPVDVIDSSSVDVPARVRELTGGKGADIVYNTVGDSYYEQGTKSLAIGGRQIFISAINKIVHFDIFSFYRGRHTYVGVDSLALTSTDTGNVLRELLPGFASGHLKPFPIVPSAIYPLESARKAYIAVLGAARDRLVFKPGKS